MPEFGLPLFRLAPDGQRCITKVPKNYRKWCEAYKQLNPILAQKLLRILKKKVVALSGSRSICRFNPKKYKLLQLVSDLFFQLK